MKENDDEKIIKAPTSPAPVDESTRFMWVFLKVFSYQTLIRWLGLIFHVNTHILKFKVEISNKQKISIYPVERKRQHNEHWRNYIYDGNIKDYDLAINSTDQDNKISRWVYVRLLSSLFQWNEKLEGNSDPHDPQ